MAQRPTKEDGTINYIPWATVDSTDTFVSDKGVIYENVQNKYEPLLQFKSDGYAYSKEKGFPYQYLNYQWYGAHLWIKHLDQRYVVGDVYEGSAPKPLEEINEQLGGSWEVLGTDGVTHFWRKIT